MKNIIEATYFTDTDVKSICISIYDGKINHYSHFWIDVPNNPNKILRTTEWLNSIIANISYDSICDMLYSANPSRHELAWYLAEEIQFRSGNFNIDTLLDGIFISSDKAFAYECARLYGLA